MARAEARAPMSVKAPVDTPTVKVSAAALAQVPWLLRPALAGISRLSAVGALAVWLARRHLSVHTARVAVFAACGLLCGLCVLVPWLGKGWPLLFVLSLAGAGALGVFPLYHAFTQDISGEHQGKITGMAGVVTWLITAQMQKLFGMLADRTQSFDLGLALAGLLPLIAVVPLWLFWNRPNTRLSSS